jgi:HTH-type transcriptional regulator/antitoxin HigA
VSQVGFQFGNAAFKRTLSGDAYSPATQYALYAWLGRVVQRSRKEKNKVSKYDENAINASTLKEIAQLSWFDEGPNLAIEYLNKLGVTVVIEPHLKGTMLDGAALKDIDGSPIIGLTLRHDRLDNFWFTLLHEIVHIWKHVGRDETFLDDLDISSTTDRREAEANRIAKDSLIPRVVWKRSEASRNPSERAIDELSRELKISPSIIAGRVRRESGNYRIFSDLVGSGEVKKILLT